MKSLKEIEEIRVGTFNSVDMRREHDGEVKSAGKVRGYVLCCGGTGCTSSGSAAIIDEMHKQLEAFGLSEEIKVIKTGCFGLCALGPIMVIYPEGAFYSRVNVEDIEEIVREHLLGGNVVKRLLYEETVEGDEIKSLNEVDFIRVRSASLFVTAALSTLRISTST